MAGNRIKGITVEIGGDVTGLDKALKTVNKTIKDTQSQLKDVERLLKLDPGNTELLAQKQKLLKDAVSATKDKLQDLKKAQEQAQKQLANGELGQDKYDALQREIIETEQELEKLEKEASKSSVALNKIAAAGEGLKEIGGKVKEVGQGLTTHVTAPILAIGAASIAAFTEVDSAIDGMITKTGAAGEELENMQQAVENIATTIPTDFQTAAGAVGEVSTRFSDVGDNLEELSKKFVEFATINNIDVVTAVDNVQASMAAFGEPTSRAGIVLDTLNGIAQQTGVDINTLTTLLTQNAGVMKEMGLDYEDAANFLANLNKNGVDVNTTMTALKKAWQTASKEGKSMSEMLADMNKKIKEAKTDQEAYQAAIELFGAKAGPAIAEAIRDGRLSLEELNVLMSDYAGNVENTFNATLDPIDQNTMLLNELKLLGSELAATFQDMLLPVMETLREKLAALREWWAGLDESQQQNIIRIAGIVAAIGPLLVVIGQVISMIGTIMTLAPMIGAAITALSGPVGIVIGIIAGLVAVGILLYKNWDKIKAKAAELGAAISEKWEEIKTKTSETWTSIKEDISSKWEDIKTNTADKVSEIKENASQTFGEMKTDISDKFGEVKEAALQKFQDIKDGIKDKIDAAKDAVSNAIEKIKDLFDFQFEIPHIPLPHFAISPPGWTWEDLLKGVIPSLGIEWYKKAMKNGMILNSPTIFGMKDGQLLGAGEAGSETVVGTGSLMKMIQAAVANANQTTYGDMTVNVMSYGTDATTIAEEIGAELNRKLRMSGAW